MKNGLVGLRHAFKRDPRDENEERDAARCKGGKRSFPRRERRLLSKEGREALWARVNKAGCKRRGTLTKRE